MSMVWLAIEVLFVTVVTKFGSLSPRIVLHWDIKGQMRSDWGVLSTIGKIF